MVVIVMAEAFVKLLSCCVCLVLKRGGCPIPSCSVQPVQVSTFKKDMSE